MINDRQLVSLLSQLAFLLAVYIWFWQRILLTKKLCAMSVAHVIWHSECKSCWNICKSSQRKSGQHYFKTCNCRRDLHHFDRESEAQNMAWKHVTSPPPGKLHAVASVREVMATVFWEFKGIVLIDYVKYGSTITATYHPDLIGKRRTALKEKRRGKLRRDVLFHQDNATYSQVITSTDCHPKCQFWTAPSHTVFTRLGPQWLLFVTKTEEIYERTEICRQRGCYLHRNWLAGGPWSKILLQWNLGFGEMLEQVYFCWRVLCCKVTKYHVHILFITVSGYELLNAPRKLSASLQLLDLPQWNSHCVPIET